MGFARSVPAPAVEGVVQSHRSVQLRKVVAQHPRQAERSDRDRLLATKFADDSANVDLHEIVPAGPTPNVRVQMTEKHGAIRNRMNNGQDWGRASGERAPRSLIWVHFDIVRGCQLRCIGCPIATLQPPISRIDIDTFDRCLGNIDVRLIGLLRLFNFGEPLLHRDLPGLLDVIPKQNWKAQNVEISTNAQYTDWPSFEAALATRVLTRLVVSCDGDGTPESYEAHRPPARWSVLLAFLERARAIRDHVHPKLHLMTRTICNNAEGQARWRSVLEPRGWSPEFRDWIALPESPRSRAEPPPPGRGICLFQTGATHIYIDADGNVVPCCAHPGAAILGSLQHNRLSEILIGEQRKSFLAALAVRDPSLKVCSACAY